MTLAIFEEVVRGTRGRTEKEDGYAFQCLARKLSVFSQSFGATALQLLTSSRCGQVRNTSRVSSCLLGGVRWACLEPRPNSKSLA
mmetsp:Transcript_26160/g.68839  ORF Transcript_26160/g.68839 Transcript_26160/m.68839 type:complete len:85 (+) Transcript_26160:1180-1434(+)